LKNIVAFDTTEVGRNSGKKKIQMRNSLTGEEDFPEEKDFEFDTKKKLEVALGEILLCLDEGIDVRDRRERKASGCHRRKPRRRSVDRRENWGMRVARASGEGRKARTGRRGNGSARIFGSQRKCGKRNFNVRDAPLWERVQG